MIELAIFQTFIYLWEKFLTEMFVLQCGGIPGNTHDCLEFLRGCSTCIGRCTKEKTSGCLDHTKLTGCFGKVDLDVLCADSSIKIRHHVPMLRFEFTGNVLTSLQVFALIISHRLKDIGRFGRIKFRPAVISFLLVEIIRCS